MLDMMMMMTMMMMEDFDFLVLILINETNESMFYCSFYFRFLHTKSSTITSLSDMSSVKQFTIEDRL